MSVCQKIYVSHGKNILDRSLAFVAIICLSPLFLVIAVSVKLDSEGPVFFQQDRVGLHGKIFCLLKFRTMVEDASSLGPMVTKAGDQRVTNVGLFLRRYKLDELPQLINILAGEMSFVGPRPEIEKYVSVFSDDYKMILSVKPGLTDYASLAFKDEEKYLAQFDNMEYAYITKVLPRKIELYRQYLRKVSLVVDAVLILKTLFRVIVAK